MDEPRLKEDFFFLLSYLLSSARGLYEEPAEYGVFRLLDTAARLLEMMSSHGLLDDPFLQKLKERLADEMEGSMDNDRQRQRLDEMLEMISSEMAQRLNG